MSTLHLTGRLNFVISSVYHPVFTDTRRPSASLNQDGPIMPSLQLHAHETVTWPTLSG